MIKRLLIYTLILILVAPMSSCRRRIRSEKKTPRTERKTTSRNERRQTNVTSGKTVIKMRKESGVYYVPCKINGMEMEFIFDTGASDITMSLTEAKFLFKQGKLTVDDFVGVQQYQIADGSIHEGISVILRKVEIGGKVLSDIEASIVDNEEAPLLLGQSALAKFGKISIDYKQNEITFE